jgi:hypothetical protein
MILTVAVIISLLPLAIRTGFQRMYILTALSDYTSSWNSLGASFLYFYLNSLPPLGGGPDFHVATSFTSVTVIDLQTIASVLFSILLINETSIQPVSTIIGFPDFNTALGLGNASDDLSLLCQMQQ